MIEFVIACIFLYVLLKDIYSMSMHIIQTPSHFELVDMVVNYYTHIGAVSSLLINDLILKVSAFST